MTAERMLRDILAEAWRERLVEPPDDLWAETWPANVSSGEMVGTANRLAELVRWERNAAVDQAVGKLVQEMRRAGMLDDEWSEERWVEEFRALLGR